MASEIARRLPAGLQAGFGRFMQWGGYTQPTSAISS